ncbi:MAG: hypothetical protein ACOC2U_03685 [bacterium]
MSIDSEKYYNDTDEYELEEQESLVVSKDGEVVNEKTLTPYEKIRAIAEQSGIEIKNPRSGCKHCYGRGYVGFKVGTEEPIPCSCIYTNEQRINGTNSRYNYNRKEKRRLAKKMKKQLKNISSSNKEADQ